MKNFVQDGNTVTMVSPTGGCKSGDAVLIGSVFGVACGDAAEGDDMELQVVGVFDLPSSGVIAAGAACYWDASGKEITATASAHVLVGSALLAVGSGGTVARVRLIGGPALV